MKASNASFILLIRLEIDNLKTVICSVIIHSVSCMHINQVHLYSNNFDGAMLKLP